MGKRNSREDASRIEDREPNIVEHVSVDDDEEITEDEAFNSDDERMYGHLFRNGNEEEEADGNDEFRDDDDGGQYMLGLLDKLGTAERSEESKPTSLREKLTLDTLMGGLNDTRGYNELRKSLLNKQETVSAPISTKHSDREQRNHTYAEQVKNLSGWTKVIQQNRQSETLDFKPKTQVETSKDSLVTVFEPRSEFEHDLQKALEQAGQEDEDAVLREEERALQDDLGSNRLSMDEYQKRRSQLAQVRALMFYHEQKRHHIKKIKSKKYRRIRKKQRQRQQDSILEAAIQEDENLANEMKHKEEISRIQERMTLAHKNTSKWAKRILKRGKNVDLETRKALSAQLKRGDDLRRKMIDNNDQSASGGDSDEEDLVASTQNVLSDIQSKGVGEDERYGLFKLSFMQKGIQKQRNLAKEEARELLIELRSHRIKDSKEKNLGTNEVILGDERVASSQEMRKHLATGELVAKSREFGVSNSLVSSGPLRVIHDGELCAEKPSLIDAAATNENETVLGVTKECFGKGSFDGKQLKNPWIGSMEYDWTTNAISKAKNERNTSKAKGSDEVLDLDAVVTSFDQRTKSPETPSSSNTKLSRVARQGKITSLNQDELVRRAFATTATKEVTAEFARETEEIVVQKSSKEGDLKASSGWGSWAGIGAPPPRQARRGNDALPSQKDSKPDGKRAADGKPDVIINKKRLKKASDVFMLGELPHPFTSREEYEQVMLGGVGREWNVTSAYRNMTRPEILTRSGKSIRPISKSAKVKRAAAKF